MIVDKRHSRIAILLPDLRGGGAEKMHLPMAQMWLEKGIAVDFVLLSRQGELLDSVPPNARVVSLEARRTITAIRPLARYLRDNRPNALLAAMWPLTTAATLAMLIARMQGSVVLSEHSNMSAQYKGWGWVHNMAMRLTMAWAFRKADHVVPVSHGVANDLAGLAWMDEQEFQVIYNPAATQGSAGVELLVHNKDARDDRLVLSVGSLKDQKNHALLIRAFSALCRKIPCRLRILGEGALRGELEDLVRECGMESFIDLPGFVDDPAQEYLAADLFVLSSDYEGFGNVIVEALEQGTPVVSTDCPFGPREILEDGKYGTLVPVGDVEALARAMEDALTRTHDRDALKRRAQDFSVEKAADAYLDLLLPGWRERSVA